jgi:hypothetical protein
LQSANPRIVVVDGEPHVCLFATKRLAAGQQILYDCGVNIPFEDKVLSSSVCHLDFSLHDATQL